MKLALPLFCRPNLASFRSAADVSVRACVKRIPCLSVKLKTFCRPFVSICQGISAALSSIYFLSNGFAHSIVVHHSTSHLDLSVAGSLPKPAQRLVARLWLRTLGVPWSMATLRSSGCTCERWLNCNMLQGFHRFKLKSGWIAYHICLICIVWYCLILYTAFSHLHAAKVCHRLCGGQQQDEKLPARAVAALQLPCNCKPQSHTKSIKLLDISGLEHMEWYLS